MKKLSFFLILITMLTGCNNETKKPSGSQSAAEIQETVISRDSATTSVVWPVNSEKQITVGGSDADISGFSSEAIQTAINALQKEGNGGSVVLSPGIYDITAPVRLYDNISLVGSGQKTILKKCKGYSSQMTIDADYGELEITVSDASGFKPGMGVAIYDNPQRSGWDLTTARITDIKGNTVYVDEYLVRDYRSDKGGMLSNASSVIEAVSAKNVRIADLTVDGSRESNDLIDGCRAGGVYLHKVHKAVVENVTVKNFNSDGISWQITEYVTVRNCEVYGCSNSGLHPGTGSPFTLIEGNRSHDNDGYGLFVCWRVRNGIVRNNIFNSNGRNGICTGHKDTDMLFADNHIYENGADGIHLRGETDLNAPHRTIIKNNIIENNGKTEGGYGISINCKAQGVIIEENTIRNTGSGKQRAALLLMENSLPAAMMNNKISGLPDGEIVSLTTK